MENNSTPLLDDGINILRLSDFYEKPLLDQKSLLDEIITVLKSKIKKTQSLSNNNIEKKYDFFQITPQSIIEEYDMIINDYTKNTYNNKGKVLPLPIFNSKLIKKRLIDNLLKKITKKSSYSQNTRAPWQIELKKKKEEQKSPPPVAPKPSVAPKSSQSVTHKVPPPVAPKPKKIGGSKKKIKNK